MLRFLSPLFRRRIPEEQQSSPRDWNKKKSNPVSLERKEAALQNRGLIVAGAREGVGLGGVSYYACQ